MACVYDAVQGGWRVQPGSAAEGGRNLQGGRQGGCSGTEHRQGLPRYALPSSRNELCPSCDDEAMDVSHHLHAPSAMHVWQEHVAVHKSDSHVGYPSEHFVSVTENSCKQTKSRKIPNISLQGYLHKSFSRRQNSVDITVLLWGQRAVAN